MSLEERIAALRGEGKEREAVTLVIQSLSHAVHGYVRTMLRDEDAADDALSQWAERVWRGLGTFEGRSSLKTWALRIACNVALNLRNEAHARRVRRFETGEASALAQSVRTSSQALMDRRRREFEAVRREELDADEQRLISLRVELDLPWNEVAEILSASEGRRVSADTAAKRYERLKQKLERLLRARGLL